MKMTRPTENDNTFNHGVFLPIAIGMTLKNKLLADEIAILF